MKFARYLEETQTPEWQKAYIDYRGLKKRITAIRRSRAALGLAESHEDLILSPVEKHTKNAELNARDADGPARESIETVSSAAESVQLRSPTHQGQHVTLPPPSKKDQSLHSNTNHSVSQSQPTSAATRPPHVRSTTVESTASGHPRASRARSGTVTSALGRAFMFPRAHSTRGNTSGPSGEIAAPRFDLKRPIPLMDLLPELTPVEKAFFDKLDEELDKVESFYCEREKEMRHRANLLKEQLQALKDHRRAFYDAHPATASPYAWLPLPLLLPPPTIPSVLTRRRKAKLDHPPPSSPHPHRETSPVSPPAKAAKYRRSSFTFKHPDSPQTTAAEVPEVHLNAKASTFHSVDGEPNSDETDTTLAGPSGSGSASASASVPSSQRWRNKSKSIGVSKSVQALFPTSLLPNASLVRNAESTTDAGVEADNEEEEAPTGDEGTASSPGENATGTPRYDPEEYQHAKKQLKKAVVECYRGLELLNNYRTLNLIGFRKALKKFEKVTRIPAQVAYTREKIEPSAFSSGTIIEDLINDMEMLFAARFARGDKKRAMARLRGGSQHTSHHFSTFRTGVALGLAVPALADGLYKSFLSDTRAEIPGWDGLMYVYGIFFVPTFFSLLVGVNLLVWARARINYVFIFELDLRTKMDYRVYFELPAFLLSLLCYAFWLSYSRIGTSSIAPTSWPLLWLAFTALVLLNPIPMMFKSSRWWLLRNVSRLLTSGAHRVEFADFWMGDQFCSLIFTLGNLYYVVCVYATGLDPEWRRCTTNHGPKWGVPFLLASLPLLARLVQSVKRYVDSGLVTHLINGGKYGSGIVQYLFYFLWRSQGGARGPIFVAWCVFATNYSLYAGAWDLLMDWSLLRPHAPYTLLRHEMLYNNAIPFYYFAIVTNILIRFIWVIYIPEKGPNFIIRTFIAGMLEVLRRWQWNFLRLENEHLGNVDQYRVTREVPLPYSHEIPSHDSDADNDEDARTHRSVSSSKSWRMRRSRPLDPDDEVAAESGGIPNN